MENAGPGDVTLKLTDEDGKVVEGVTKEKVTVTGKVAKGENITVNLFDPAGSAKRSDLAAMLTKYFQLAENAE